MFEPSLRQWELGLSPNPDVWCNKFVANIDHSTFYTDTKNLEKLNLVLCWTGCPPTTNLMTMYGLPQVSLSLILSEPSIELCQVITRLKGGP